MKSLHHGHDLDDCNISLEEHETNALARDLLVTLDKDYKIIWPDRVICDDQTCHAEIDGTFIFRDFGHFSYEGVEYLGREMDFYGSIVSEENDTP